MKKFLLIPVLFCSLILFVKAQETGGDKKERNIEKIKALKIAFLTKKLELTSEEAEKFWPVYNKYESEQIVMLKDFRNSTYRDPLVLEQKILDLKKKYKQEFVKVLGAQKANDLYKFEMEFRGLLIKQFKNREMNRKQPQNKE